MPKKIKGDMLTAEIIGDDAIIKALGQLAKDSTRRKILRPAISEAASAMVKTARSLVPIETGELKKSIGQKVVTVKRSGTIIGVVGPRRGFKRAVVRMSRYKPAYFNNPVRYAHLIEFGTPQHGPQAFMRPAMDNTPTASIIRRRTVYELNRQAEIARRKGRTL